MTAHVVTREALAAALRKAGFVDPEDDTVPLWREEVWPVWVTPDVAAGAILTALVSQPGETT